MQNDFRCLEPGPSLPWPPRQQRLASLRGRVACTVTHLQRRQAVLVGGLHVGTSLDQRLHITTRSSKAGMLSHPPFERRTRTHAFPGRICGRWTVLCCAIKGSRTHVCQGGVHGPPACPQRCLPGLRPSATDLWDLAGWVLVVALAGDEQQRRVALRAMPSTAHACTELIAPRRLHALPSTGLRWACVKVQDGRVSKVSEGGL